MLLEDFLTKHRPCGCMILFTSRSEIVCINCNELRGVTCDAMLGGARKFYCDCPGEPGDADPCERCGGGRI